MKNEIVKNISKTLVRNNIDAIFIAPSEDLVLLAGKSIYLCERFQGLFITKEGKKFYICNLLHSDEVNEIADDKTMVYEWFDEEDFIEVTKKAFLDFGLLEKKIAVNAGARGFNLLQIAMKTGVEFVNGKQLLEEVRIIKTSTELENLRQASRITDEVFIELLKFIKPGVRECEIKEEMGRLFEQRGIPKGSFGGLVASGSNSSLPHYFGDQRVLEEKDILLVDFGCSYGGMNADTSRTVFIGDISEKEKEIYNIVLKANLAAEEMVKTGAYIPDISKAARSTIEKEGYGKFFNHRLGHGIGYSVHESPEITAINKRKLEVGMAFTIEPGIYLPGQFGVRIEDVVIINEHGEVEILNKTSKTITMIK